MAGSVTKKVAPLFPLPMITCLLLLSLLSTTSTAVATLVTHHASDRSESSPVASPSSMPPDVEITARRDTGYVIVRDARSLELSCRADINVTWCADYLDLSQANLTSSFEAGEHHQRPYITNLTVPKVNFRQVGCLVCAADCDAQDWSYRCRPDHKDTVYLYVKDENNLLVNHTSKDNYVHFATAGVPFTVPCIPTSPDINTRLRDGYGEELNDAYDPFYGYKVTESLPGHNSYTCSAEGYYIEPVFTVNVFAKDYQVPAPVMSARGAWQRNPLPHDAKVHYDVVEGQNVTLVCGSNNTSKHRPIVTWTLGEGTAVSRNTGDMTDLNKNRTHIHHLYSIIDGVKGTDAGEYECRITMKPNVSAPGIIDLNVVELDSEYIDMEIPRPNLTLCQDHNPPTTTTSAAPTHCEGSAMWQVLYQAHPRPHFKWYRERTDESELMLATSKDKSHGYEMDLDYHNGTLNLTIKRPKVSDIGEHKVNASIRNSSLVKNISFYFEMPVPPKNMTMFPEGGLWLAKGEGFKIICKASGYPVPEINLFFQACSNKSSCQDFDLQNNLSEAVNSISKTPDRTLTLVMRESVWEGRAHQPGNYRCDAENIHGKNMTDPWLLLVSEDKIKAKNISVEATVEGEPMVVEDNGTVLVTKGDNTTLTCWTNKMLASRHPYWKLYTSVGHHGASEETEMMNNKDGATNFSYTSKIDVSSHIREVDDFSLKCFQDSDTFMTVHFLIQPEEKPVWDANAHLRPEYELSISEGLNLTCSASGNPKPHITWYKDHRKLTKGTNAVAQGRIEVTGDKNEHISFKFMLTEDSGTYTCKAENRVNSVSMSTHINVKDPNAQLVTYSTVFISILIVILFIFIGFLARRIHRDRKHSLHLQLREQQMFNEGDPANLNPQITVDQQADLLPYNSKYEVPRDNIILEKLLGAGAFGRVYRATALNLVPGEARTTVAVKMIKSRTDSVQLKALRSELKIMIHIGRHVNIVNLLGAHSKNLASKGELLLVVEFCRYGNILDYMHCRRKDFINQINNEDKIDPSITDQGLRAKSRGAGTLQSGTYGHLSITPYSAQYSAGHSPDSNNSERELLCPGASSFHFMGTNSSISSSYNHHVMSDMTTVTYMPSEGSVGNSEAYSASRVASGVTPRLCTEELLRWAYQIAKGMEYLSFRKVLHGDLAARNILLAENNIVKISDFGLSRDIYKDKKYRKKDDGLVPVKWVALESLQEGVFSTQSDVWSFGVVLWEIFSLGKVPYPGVEVDENFVTKLELGLRLDQPKYSTRELYRLMLECWNHNPMGRPSFSCLENSLGDILGEAEKQYFLEMNRPYWDDKPDNQFLDMLQSQDYAAKIQQTDPEENEQRFRPMQCHENLIDMLSEGEESSVGKTTDLLSHQSSAQSDASCYLLMSPSNQDHQVMFTFDREQQNIGGKIPRRRDKCDSVSSGHSFYLKMDSGSRVAHPHIRPGAPPSQQNTNPPIRLEDPFSFTHDPKSPHQILPGQEGHDSGLHTSSSCLQNNPHYMTMDSSANTGDPKDASQLYWNVGPGKEVL